MKPRVLLVDDDCDFQSIVSDWLSARYEPIALSSGRGILEQLEWLDPAAAILDVRMPGGPDGFKVCRQVRADPRFSALPILFLTGCKEDEDFARNIDAGGTAFLTKPVGRKRLLSVLGELVRG